MAFWRIRSNIESMTKSLEGYILLYTPPIKSCSAYPTNPTILVIACGFTGSDITIKFCAMKVFLHCFFWKPLLVDSPPLLKLTIADAENETQRWAWSFSFCPLLLEPPTDFCEFLWISLPNADIAYSYPWRNNDIIIAKYYYNNKSRRVSCQVLLPYQWWMGKSVLGNSASEYVRVWILAYKRWQLGIWSKVPLPSSILLIMFCWLMDDADLIPCLFIYYQFFGWV